MAPLPVCSKCGEHFASVTDREAHEQTCDGDGNWNTAPSPTADDKTPTDNPPDFEVQ